MDMICSGSHQVWSTQLYFEEWMSILKKVECCSFGCCMNAWDPIAIHAGHLHSEKYFYLKLKQQQDFYVKNDKIFEHEFVMDVYPRCYLEVYL